MSPLTNGDRERDRRIIVIVLHEPGSLAKVRVARGEAKIAGDSVVERSVGELGTISLQTGENDAALPALLQAGLRAETSDAIVVPRRDRPGALAEVAQPCTFGNTRYHTPCSTRRWGKLRGRTRFRVSRNEEHGRA